MTGTVYFKCSTTTHGRTEFINAECKYESGHVPSGLNTSTTSANPNYSGPNPGSVGFKKEGKSYNWGPFDISYFLICWWNPQ